MKNSCPLCKTNKKEEIGIVETEANEETEA
jgi:hypothetical protein